MSLLDTIRAARQEAEDAGTLPGRGTAKPAEQDDQADADAQPASFSRKSAARAKPKRAAAGTVRIGEKPSSQKTKEERKAERAARRSDDDLRQEAATAILKKNPSYRRFQRVWLAGLIGGLVASLASYLIVRMVQNGQGNADVLAIVSIVLMVGAYVMIIGAFVFDLLKIRPLRNRASEMVVGISIKRLRKMLDEGTLPELK